MPALRWTPLPPNGLEACITSFKMTLNDMFASALDSENAAPATQSILAKHTLQLRKASGGLKKQTRGQPWYPYALVSASIGFFLCIGVQCFGSSSSKVVTFPYKCSMRSTLCQLPAPAGKSQLFSTSVVSKVHFGSSSWKVATCQ